MFEVYQSSSNWYKKGSKDKKNDEIDIAGGQKGGERKKWGQSGKRLSGEKRNTDVEEEAETVMFLPCTPRGELLKKLREIDDRFRAGTKIRRIKFVERRVYLSRTY